MDDSFYFFVLAIPATCAFWFLYAIIVTELANWSTRRRNRAHKAKPARVSTKSESPKTQKQPHKTVRGFDSPELFREDMLKRIERLRRRLPKGKPPRADQSHERTHNKGCKPSPYRASRRSRMGRFTGLDAKGESVWSSGAGLFWFVLAIVCLCAVVLFADNLERVRALETISRGVEAMVLGF